MVYGRTSKRVSRKRMYRRRRTTPFKKAPTKSLVRNYKTKQLVKLIKGVTLKQSETCYKTTSHKAYTINHDSLTELPIWNPTVPFFPSQGNSDGERRGDEIICQGFRIRGILQIPPDRRNTVVKIWFLPYNSEQGSPTTYSQFFHNVVSNVMCDPVQTDRWRGIKYLGSYRIKARDLVNGEDHATIIINRWVSMRKKVRFLNDGVTQPSNLKERGSLIMTAYDAIGTTPLDTLVDGSEWGITLYYKDP